MSIKNIKEEKLMNLIKKAIKEVAESGNRNKEILKEQAASKDRVRLIQQILIKKGYDLGPHGSDGLYGSKTRQAVMQFQKDNGIKQTGYVGKLTTAALGLNQSTAAQQKPTNNTQQKPTSNVSSKGNHVAAPDKKPSFGASLASTYADISTKANNQVSSAANDVFKSQFKLGSLSTTDSVEVCKAGQENCAQFVNDFSDDIEFVGDAWLAHDIDKAGKRVWSVYTSLKPDAIKKINDIFTAIDKAGNWVDNGPMSAHIKELNQGLINANPINRNNLRINDVVGIYYPGSSHHEEAFYEAGKPYFVKDAQGQVTMGKTLASGKGFGMNTHLGIVGAIKDGIPLIFHNISGNVFSDPYNKIRNGGIITWIKRK